MLSQAPSTQRLLLFSFGPDPTLVASSSDGLFTLWMFTALYAKTYVKTHTSAVWYDVVLCVSFGLVGKHFFTKFSQKEC